MVKCIHTGGSAAIPLQVLRSADQAQGNAGTDVSQEREANEQRLGKARLVDLAGEEEVGFGGGNGLRRQRDERGSDEVDRGKDGESVGAVALNSRNCRLSIHLGDGSGWSEERTIVYCSVAITTQTQSGRTRRGAAARGSRGLFASMLGDRRKLLVGIWRRRLHWSGVEVQ
jgi:hypothetical protein